MKCDGYRFYWTLEQENGFIAAGRFDMPIMVGATPDQALMEMLEGVLSGNYPGVARINGWEKRADAQRPDVKVTHVERIPAQCMQF